MIRIISNLKDSFILERKQEITNIFKPRCEASLEKKVGLNPPYNEKSAF